jgi:hypothetical protein
MTLQQATSGWKSVAKRCDYRRGGYRSIEDNVISVTLNKWCGNNKSAEITRNKCVRLSIPQGAFVSAGFKCGDRLELQYDKAAGIARLISNPESGFCFGCSPSNSKAMLKNKTAMRLPMTIPIEPADLEFFFVTGQTQYTTIYHTRLGEIVFPIGRGGISKVNGGK